MRQKFEQQITLGTTAIPDVKINLKSRDELPPILMALQYIFITPELNSQIFKLLEEKVCNNKKKTGRKGMDLWHILCLAIIRHGCSTNWDKIEDWSNEHRTIRQIMGVCKGVLDEDECNKITFNRQTIMDNVSFIDEKMLEDINLIVVKSGHKLFKKKEEPKELSLKTDSYAVESNVHFPTDLNLLWDSMRKCLDVIVQLQEKTGLKGWREVKSWRSKFKSQFRSTSTIVFKGKDENKKKSQVSAYLNMALQLKERCEAIIKTPPITINTISNIEFILHSLGHYCHYVTLFCDQIERRLIKGETIPANEKVFSIFEPYTEWLTKGKLNKKVELGMLLNVTTDENNLIVDYKVMEKERDVAQVAPLIERIEKNFPEYKIKSASFDKGFYSKSNKEVLENSKIEQSVLPKRGRHSREDKERESTVEYKAIRNQHSAIESNINMLEHHGLNRCPDKGKKHFKRYVGLSILAYNLHIIGNCLIEKEKTKKEKSDKRKSYYKKQAA